MQKLGDVIDVSNTGGYCGWRDARVVSEQEDTIHEHDFAKQLGKDYAEENMRGKIKPTPKYDKSEALRFTWPRKRKSVEFFEAHTCLPFVARHYRRSLMSCCVTRGDMSSITTVCHYQKDGTVNIYPFD